MSNPPTPENPPRLLKWPFILGDALLLLVALVCYAQGGHWPFGSKVGLAPWLAWLLTLCVFLGACLSLLPILLEYRAGLSWAKLGRIQAALERVRNVEQIGRQISSATAAWQAVQDDAAKAMEAAQGLQGRMTAEAQAFQEFLQRAQDTERAHLRLEVEKLHRAEGEWLQVLVRILDHVWALYQAAVRSGKVNLVEQLSHFQRACRDTAQKVGVVPFVAQAGESLNAELHQPARAPEGDLAGAKIATTVATGFRFQGQLVRKALVLVQREEEATAAAAESPATDAAPSASEAEPPSTGSGQTEFTRRLASDFEQSADTEFVRALSSRDPQPDEYPTRREVYPPATPAPEEPEPGNPA